MARRPRKYFKTAKATKRATELRERNAQDQRSFKNSVSLISDDESVVDSGDGKKDFMIMIRILFI
jgi:hypothetical protein